MNIKKIFLLGLFLILQFFLFFFFEPLSAKPSLSKPSLSKGDEWLEKAVRDFNCKEYARAAQKFILAVNYDSTLSDYGRLKHAECMKFLYKKSNKAEYLKSALDSFKRLIKFYPDSPFLYKACFQTAHLYEIKGDFKQAAKFMEQAVEEGHKRPEVEDIFIGYSLERVYDKLNDYYSRMKKWSQASDVYFNMISSKWTKLNGYVLRQKLQSLKKKYRNFKFIEKKYYRIMARLYYRMSKYDDALRVLSFKPVKNDIPMMKLMARSLYKLKKYTMSMEYWSNIQTLKKNNRIIIAECRYNRAKCLKALKKYEDAKKECYDIALDIPDSYLADNALYLAAFMDSKNPDIELLKRLIEAYPKGDVVQSAIDVVVNNLVESKGAGAQIPFLKHIVKKGTSSTVTQCSFALADAYKSIGKTQKSEKLMENIYNQDPENFYGLMAHYGFNRVNKLANMKFSKKRKDYDQMNRLKPKELGLSFKEFAIAKKLRLNRACLLFLHDIIRRDPNNIEAGFNLSLYYYMTGKYRKSYALAAGSWKKRGHKEKYPELIYLVYPLAYISHILDYSGNIIDPLFVLSIMREETHYLPDDISWTGAIGLMQIMPSTGEWIASKIDEKNFKKAVLFNPRINIKFGCWYINFLFKDLGKDIFDIAAAYNGGQGSVKKWRKSFGYLKKGAFIEKIPFEQTRRYVKKVMKSYLMYRKIYSDTPVP